MYTVVIPARNESNRIGDVLAALKKYAGISVVVVDDGSTDDTGLIAQKYTPYVLKHRINLGKGAALKTGSVFAFYYLNAEAVIFMDSDGQHDVEDLPKFIEKLDEKHDIVLGVRKRRHVMAIHRAIMNKLSSWTVKQITGKHIPDIPCGYKALTRSVFETIDWTSSDYSVELEISIKMAKRNIPFVSVPIKTIYYRKDHAMNGLDLIKVSTQLISWSFGR